jgi:hypothetical protein
MISGRDMAAVPRVSGREASRAGFEPLHGVFDPRLECRAHVVMLGIRHHQVNAVGIRLSEFGDNRTVEAREQTSMTEMTARTIRVAAKAMGRAGQLVEHLLTTRPAKDAVRILAEFATRPASRNRTFCVAGPAPGSPRRSRRSGGLQRTRGLIQFSPSNREKSRSVV